MLGRLANRCKVNKPTLVLVPSKVEKWLMQFLFNDVAKNFEFFAISECENRNSSDLSKVFCDSVEYKRGSISRVRLQSLINGLNWFLDNLLEQQSQTDAQIWIYNKWTWIGRCLASQKSVSSCYAFESANFKKSICLISDLSANNAEKSRREFLNYLTPFSAEVSAYEVHWIKRLRLPALIISIINRGGWSFYSKRLLTRCIVIFVFKLLSRLQFRGLPKNYVLAILQIKYDSEILRHGTPK